MELMRLQFLVKAIQLAEERFFLNLLLASSDEFAGCGI